MPEHEGTSPSTATSALAQVVPSQKQRATSTLMLTTLFPLTTATVTRFLIQLKTTGVQSYARPHEHGNTIQVLQVQLLGVTVQATLRKAVFRKQ